MNPMEREDNGRGGSFVADYDPGGVRPRAGRGIVGVEYVEALRARRPRVFPRSLESIPVGLGASSCGGGTKIVREACTSWANANRAKACANWKLSAAECAALNCFCDTYGGTDKALEPGYTQGATSCNEATGEGCGAHGSSAGAGAGGEVSASSIGGALAGIPPVVLYGAGGLLALILVMKMVKS